MVFICDKKYDNDEYDNYFEKYPFYSLNDIKFRIIKSFLQKTIWKKRLT